ncbi:MAG TPA: hypothetical protein VFU73_03710 [Actinocrinis sp.]|nr:hypothetical protein [Actinocrinis sp.]
MAVFANVVSYGLAVGGAVCLGVAFARIGRRDRLETRSHLRKP